MQKTNLSKRTKQTWQLLKPLMHFFANYCSIYIQSLQNWRSDRSSAVYAVISPGKKDVLLYWISEICHIIPFSQEYFKERFITQMLFKNWGYQYLLDCSYVFYNKAHSNMMLKL